MTSARWIGMGAALVAAACGGDGSTKKADDGDAAAGGPGADASNGAGGASSGGASSGGASAGGASAGGAGTGGADAGVPDAASGGATDASAGDSAVVDSAVPCALPPLDCAGLAPSTSTYDFFSGRLVLGVGTGAAPIVSGTLTRTLDCAAQTEIWPITSTEGALVADLVPDGGSSIQTLDPCVPARLDLVDSCGRQVVVEVALSYSSEGVPLSISCPATDGGT